MNAFKLRVPSLSKGCPIVGRMIGPGVGFSLEMAGSYMNNVLCSSGLFQRTSHARVLARKCHKQSITTVFLDRSGAGWKLALQGANARSLSLLPLSFIPTPLSLYSFTLQIMVDPYRNLE